MEYDRVSLEDWQKQQPLSVLQLDTADRVVLRVAGTRKMIFRKRVSYFFEVIKGVNVAVLSITLISSATFAEFKHLQTFIPKVSR